MMRRIALSLFLMLLLMASNLWASQTYPQFSRDYWAGERDAANGKMWRGIGLGVLGVASIAPSAILIYKATDNPQQFLAWGIVSSIATLGMTFHGFFSIRTGIRERRRAEDFVAEYDASPDSVSLAEERATYLESKKKSAVKIMIFGGALVVQSAVMLTNGIVLAARKRQGRSIGDVKIWPSFLTGGLLLAGGTGIIIGKAMTYGALKDLENRPTDSDAATLSIQPIIQADPVTGELGVGIMGRMLF
jgi:hypothetical protein